MPTIRNIRLMGFDAPAAFAEGKAPTEIHLVPIGSFEHEMFGSFTIDDYAAERIVANFNDDENDLVIDFEHQSLSGDRAEAAIWVKELTARDDGVWATVLEYVGDTAQLIIDKKYKYISPVIDFSADDHETGNGIGPKLHSAALTNIPWFDGMTALAAKTDFKLAILTNYDNDSNQRNNNKLKENKMFEKLLELLGLKKDVSEADALDVIKNLIDKPDVKKEMLPIFTELGIDAQSTPEDALKSLKAFKAKATDGMVTQIAFDSVKDELAKIVLNTATEKAEAAVDKYIVAGKFTPAQKDHLIIQAKSDLEAFVKFADASPVIVDLKGDRQGGNNNAPSDTVIKFNKLIDDKFKEIKSDGQSYSEAVRLVAKEHPDLASQAQADGMTRTTQYGLPSDQ